ncbi:MAG: TRAP transporter large permease subunit [Hominisplanchenecus sp.]
MVSVVLFLSFFILLILNVPISLCLGLSSVCAILYSGTSLTIVATNMYSGISKFLLLAIPFFVLSGNIMAKAGISTRLIKFVDTCVGHRKGGIAMVCVIVACFFGAISGSGPATVAALGAVLIPAMVESGGFSAPFATALMATASSIAIVIPPSIAFVVYASITGVSIGDMFIAGIVPGILMGLALVLVVMWEVKKNNIVPAKVEKASAKERLHAFGDAFWGFLMPVIILGGIYGGIFTPTEAAAVSVVYGLFVGMVIYKEVKIKDLWDILIESAKTTGGIMLIVACASLFSFVCTQFGISQAASDLLAGIAKNQFTFLLITNIIFLIAGCFIDANSAMYIFIPIMLPVCKALGYDPIAFGIMATVNLAIGQVTPPVGVNLFVAISIKIKKGLSVTLQQISKAVVPMIAACLAVLILITYIPGISTFLPNMLGGGVSASGTGSSADSGSSQSAGKDYDTIADYSDLGWEETTWNFACSTTETSTWAKAGEKFGELMEQATGGKVKVNVYAADQLTNGSQSEGIQALMDGDPVQVSMHSNLIYSAFDPRFNVVSLPYLFDSVEEADAKLDGQAGKMMKDILSEYGLHCMGIAENGFRQLTNSVKPIQSAADMKNLKIRVAGSNLLMKCYELWGADATNLNWSETYTALQQNTVEGQENPLPAIDAASVQEVQKYVSMWNANYDCLFFCINQELYDSLTEEQRAVVDEAGKKAVDYERDINRADDENILDRWQNENGVEVLRYEELDIDSFKEAVEPVTEWYTQELKNAGYEDAEELVAAFTADENAGVYEVEDHSDLNWQEQTWNFACSTTETSTWAQAGKKFGELMEKATGGKIKVNVYAADQLTNGSQSEGIQALMDGDPVQISMHSNLIYSAFDPRFNVVSLPYLFDSVEEADAKLDGEAGEMLKDILSEYNLHCMGMAENGFRQLTNSVKPIQSVDDMKNLKIRVAGSNLLMKCYELWGADATNMNWSETYTALQQNTVEGQENPLPAIDAASVQEVQKYVSMWNANYDCLFFCINQELYDSLTAEQQAVVDECGQLAVQYEREINRADDENILERWQEKNGIEVLRYEELDIDSFKKAVENVPEWYIQELKNQGYDDAEDLVDAFK